MMGAHAACEHLTRARASYEGRLETAKCLLSRGAQIDVQDEHLFSFSGKLQQNTPLHDASRMGHSSLIHLLLQCGANQKIRNGEGKTAEEEADNEEIVEVFREFNKKGLKNKVELLKQAISEENYDVAVILILNKV